MSLKPIEFLGDALARLREFPERARRAAGYQLERIQRGLEPDDWKPMTWVREFEKYVSGIALARSG